jgi:hypothetical protein
MFTKDDLSGLYRGIHELDNGDSWDAGYEFFYLAVFSQSRQFEKPSNCLEIHSWRRF